MSAQARWAKRNPEKVKEIKRRFRERHKERIAAERAVEFQNDKQKKYAERKRWMDSNPDKASMQAVRRRLRTLDRKRGNSLRFHYAVTADQYDAILSAQKCVCAICGKPNSTKKSNRLFVDHNHTTGKLRALLCHGCNMAIGFLREDPALFVKAAAYLDAFRDDVSEEPWDANVISKLGLS